MILKVILKMEENRKMLQYTVPFFSLLLLVPSGMNMSRLA
jgi:hypothetical protein